MRGFIISTLQDDHAIIRVEFHDTSSARGFHFTDHRALSLASLGK
jgi:chromosome transmission fidelity protein 4